MLNVILAHMVGLHFPPNYCNSTPAPATTGKTANGW